MKSEVRGSLSFADQARRQAVHWSRLSNLGHANPTQCEWITKNSSSKHSKSKKKSIRPCFQLDVFVRSRTQVSSTNRPLKSFIVFGTHLANFVHTTTYLKLGTSRKSLECLLITPKPRAATSSHNARCHISHYQSSASSKDSCWRSGAFDSSILFHFLR